MRATFDSRRVVTNSGTQPARLYFTELEKFASDFLAKSLEESNWQSYHSGQNHFCRQVKVRAEPASESLLCQFVMFLAKEKFKHTSFKVYLSAIRFLHIAKGGGGFVPNESRYVHKKKLVATPFFYT